MSQHEQDKQHLGEPKLEDNWEYQESLIRREVDERFPDLAPEDKDAIIRSRMGILRNPAPPEIVQIGLGKDAYRKIRETMFE